MAAVDLAVSKIAQHCRAAAKAGVRLVKPARSQQRQVIFVAGQQRSGTNMMMDVLDRLWCTDVYHETDERAFDNYQMRDLAVIRRLHEASRASHFVIKALCELQHLRDLLDAFPKARALWLVRDYHDVCNSMVRRFSTTAEALKMMRPDPVLGGWRGEKMSAATHALLVDAVSDDITETSAAAFQWYMRNVLFFEQGLDRDDRVQVVAYERLVKEPLDTFAGVFQFLTIDRRDTTLRHVFATSIGKTERPEIDPRIDALCRQLLDRFETVLQTQH
jgi:hypothetical protein